MNASWEQFAQCDVNVGIFSTTISLPGDRDRPAITSDPSSIAREAIVETLRVCSAGRIVARPGIYGRIEQKVRYLYEKIVERRQAMNPLYTLIMNFCRGLFGNSDASLTRALSSIRFYESIETDLGGDPQYSLHTELTRQLNRRLGRAVANWRECVPVDGIGIEGFERTLRASLSASKLVRVLLNN